jgi:hypothetical protein
MEYDIIKEKYIPNAPKPITFDILKIILEQKEKCICKIYVKMDKVARDFFVLFHFLINIIYYQY